MQFMFSTVYSVTQKYFYARPYTSMWAPVIARQISKRYSSFCHVFISMLSYVYLLYYVCIAFFFTLNAGLLSRSQYSEGPATGHPDTGFSWFPCAQKQMLRWFPRFQVATTCFSCSPPDLNLVVTDFMFCLYVK